MVVLLFDNIGQFGVRSDAHFNKDDYTMNISKRTFLLSGSAALATATVATPTLAKDQEGFEPLAGAALGAAGPLALGLGAIIAIGALAGPGQGKVNVQDLSVTALNKTEDPSQRPTVLGKELEARLSKEFPEIKFNGAIVEAVRKAYGKELREGEVEIAAAGKGPKWSIKLTIVIKF